MIKIVHILIFILILSPIAVQSTYYADIELYLKNDGSLSIEGDTNLNKLQNIELSQAYTSKEGEFWTFTLDTNTQFESYSFRLHMPKYSNINYMKTTQNVKIEEDESGLVIVGSDVDDELSIKVQYSIDTNKYILSEYSLVFWGLLIASIVFIVILLKSNVVPLPKLHSQSQSIDLTQLTPRQVMIIKLLKKHKEITQKKLEELVDFPKSSLSRNLKSLETKNLIEKKTMGSINKISLKK